VELHDCFATAEILHYENLGLCGDGEAGRMIDEGELGELMDEEAYRAFAEELD